MAEFPAAPVAPAEFLTDWLPRAFADTPVPDDVKGAEIALGIRLDGDGGGEWVLRIDQGTVSVQPEPRGETAFTYVQSVDDWQGALWQGRGGAIGQGAAGLFRPGSTPPGDASGMGAPSLTALEQLRALDGVIRLVVTGGEGGDWAVAFKLGPGDIPEEPTTTVSVSHEDAAKMQSGELNPMEAFMAGRIQVAGDMALMMQMQAIQMQAAATAAAAAKSSG
ncbi:MAG: SCP2 sterol-binding domain-containing protein [Myxococcota bacterium]